MLRELLISLNTLKPIQVFGAMLCCNCYRSFNKQERVGGGGGFLSERGVGVRGGGNSYQRGGGGG